MQNKYNLADIEKIIDYKFKNKKLLETAFCHQSFAYINEVESYQNFEFLGDSILDFLVAEHLMKLYPNANEGELTKLRARVVAKDPLADVIDNAGLDEYIRTNGDMPSRKTRSDVFEAILAAIYFDSGMQEARAFVIRFLEDMMKGKTIDNDYKSMLLELSAKKHFKVEFIIKREYGPQHKPIFVYEVLIDNKALGIGEDTSKRSAQQEAARIALKHFKK